MPIGIYLRKSAEERFWANVVKTETCWLWRGNLSHEGSGYGRFKDQGYKWYAHRWAYVHLVGPIQDDLQIDHLCRVKRCVNPQHMEPVTPRVNTMRGFSPSAINARKEYCPRNHRYDLMNTYFTKAGGRHCRACERVKPEALED